MKNSKNAILRYGFQIMILIAAGFLTGGGCKDAAPVDCGALSVSDCPADKCATYTNRLTKVQFCEKKIDATGTECADLSDKICDAENVIAGKECGYLFEESSSTNKSCFELQDNCTAIGAEKELCDAIGIIKGGTNCQWNPAGGAAGGGACGDPAIARCDLITDPAQCATARVAAGLGTCYHNGVICKKQVATCSDLLVVDITEAANAVAGPNKQCYVKSDNSAVEEMVAGCAQLPKEDAAVAGRAIIGGGPVLGCFAPQGASLFAADKVADCAAAEAEGYKGLDCTNAAANQRCFENAASTCTAKRPNCAAFTGDNANCVIPNNNEQNKACFVDDANDCVDKLNSCAAFGRDVDNCIIPNNNNENKPCFVNNTGDCANKLATCAEFGNNNPDCLEPNNNNANKACFLTEAGNCATKADNCASADPAIYVHSDDCTEPNNNAVAERCYKRAAGGCAVMANDCNGANASGYAAEDCVVPANNISNQMCFKNDANACVASLADCNTFGADAANCVKENNNMAGELCYKPFAGNCTVRLAECTNVLVEQDCKAKSVTSAAAKAAGCVWGISTIGGTPPRCYTRVKRDEDEVAGTKCVNIGNDQERCLVPGIETDHTKSVSGSCNWNGGSCVAIP